MNITRTCMEYGVCMFTCFLDVENCLFDLGNTELIKGEKHKWGMVWESGSGFWIHDKESLPCDFRKPCWGSSEHPCTESLVEDRKYLVSAQSEGEISLCLLILWKLVNLKHGMGFFLLSNSGKGGWRLLFPPACHILYLSVSSYRMH